MGASRRQFIAACGVMLAGMLTACRRRSTPDTPTPSPATPTPTPSVAASSATAEPAVDPLPDGIVNVLVFGTDSREETSMTGNADALILCQISADRRHLTLVSAARDTYVPINNGHGKINSSFPMGGTDLLVATLSNLLGGLPIHLTSQANFNGFVNITRWLGGIRVLNRHASTTVVQSTGRVVEFPEGEILLENTDALIYARQRKELPLGDLDRAERHRALITGMLRGLRVMASTPAVFNDVAVKVFNNTKTVGLTAEQVPALISVLTQIDLDDVTSLMVPIARFDTIDGASVDVLDEAQTAELGRALLAGTVKDYVATFGADYTPGV